MTTKTHNPADKVERWQDFTGKIATHAETGKPFAKVTQDNKVNANLPQQQ